VCGEARDKRSLIRVARLPDGSVQVDPTGKGLGRGAYLCRDPRCFEDGRLAHRLGRALKTTVTAASLAMLADYAANLPEDVIDGT
jgi:predicted RNA-binding protein YlxR (DUF448 family)